MTASTANPKSQKRQNRETLIDAIKAGRYVPPFQQSIPSRSAHFLDWAASNFPEEFVPYNVVVRAVNGYNKTPRLDAQEVEALRGKTTPIRTILIRDYKRELTAMTGVGVRATTNTIDIVNTELQKKTDRFIKAKDALVRTHGLLNQAEISSNTLEGRWVKQELNQLIKQLKDPNFDKRYLPPARGNVKSSE